MVVTKVDFCYNFIHKSYDMFIVHIWQIYQNQIMID
jgi:hypothetical protein